MFEARRRAESKRVQRDSERMVDGKVGGVGGEAMGG